MRCRDSPDEATSAPTTSYLKGSRNAWRVSKVINTGTDNHTKQIKFLVEEQYSIGLSRKNSSREVRRAWASLQYLKERAPQPLIDFILDNFELMSASLRETAEREAASLYSSRISHASVEASASPRSDHPISHYSRGSVDYSLVRQQTRPMQPVSEQPQQNNPKSTQPLLAVSRKGHTPRRLPKYEPRKPKRAKKTISTLEDIEQPYMSQREYDPDTLVQSPTYHYYGRITGELLQMPNLLLWSLDSPKPSIAGS